MTETKPLRGKREKDPRTWKCVDPGNSRNVPQEHARSSYMPCPLHSALPIRWVRLLTNPNGTNWAVVTGQEEELDLRTVWYLGERIEPVTDRTWGVFSKIW